ncbi:TIGR01777 family oxidoreductase [Nannocystaceae bacterium ST9]
MQHFERSLELPVARDELFAWHARPGAFERLSPSWQRLEVVERSGGIEDGARLHFVIRQGPFRLHWVARHQGFVPGKAFEDVAERGPFSSWRHVHGFESLAPERARLDDRIDYSLPIFAALAKPVVTRMLERMFRQRHVRTAHDLRRHLGEGRLAPRKIAMTGASGLLGQQLTAFLTTGGHEVVPLVRRAAGPNSIAWDPAARTIDGERLEGFDAVVHLAGESVGQRWTDAVKRRVLDSRIEGTRLLCESLAARERKPAVLVCASAIGFYGDTEDRWVDEQSGPGAGFLSEVCQAWEQASEPARAAGIRVVDLRIGVVLNPRGGALAQLLLPASLGLGGPIGSGRQYLGWIDLDDLLGAVLHAIRCETLVGPVNAVSPEPVTQREFASTLGRVLRRPAFMPLPAFVIRGLFGAMGQEVLLGGQRVRPTRLLETGFRFDFPGLEDCLRHELGRCDDAAVERAAADFTR